MDEPLPRPSPATRIYHTKVHNEPNIDCISPYIPPKSKYPDLTISANCFSTQGKLNDHATISTTKSQNRLRRRELPRLSTLDESSNQALSPKKKSQSARTPSTNVEPGTFFITDLPTDTSNDEYIISTEHNAPSCSLPVPPEPETRLSHKNPIRRFSEIILRPKLTTRKSLDLNQIEDKHDKSLKAEHHRTSFKLPLINSCTSRKRIPKPVFDRDIILKSDPSIIISRDEGDLTLVTKPSQSKYEHEQIIIMETLDTSVGGTASKDSSVKNSIISRSLLPLLTLRNSRRNSISVM
ncbi:hypothetical protein AKO1_009809 [Acrasis kona]|uniref:Uncharacterized protein n=1 Tax=Acrasis kona TaxID=1008807 RepID=A0AAW2ZQG6_9EUKA